MKKAQFEQLTPLTQEEMQNITGGDLWSDLVNTLGGVNSFVTEVAAQTGITSALNGIKSFLENITSGWFNNL